MVNVRFIPLAISVCNTCSCGEGRNAVHLMGWQLVGDDKETTKQQLDGDEGFFIYFTHSLLVCGPEGHDEVTKSGVGRFMDFYIDPYI